MGFWNSFFKRIKCTRKKAYGRKVIKEVPIELIKPSTGRIVELKVTAKNDFDLRLYRNELEIYAKYLERGNVKWNFIDERTLQLTFSNDDIAEITRRFWNK